MFTLTIVFGLLLAVFSLAIILGAFKQGAAQGLLCMFVPFYAVYFAFLKWTWDKRAVVGAGYLVCLIGAPVCGFLAVKAAAESAVASLKEMATATAFPSRPSGAPGASSLPLQGTCSISYLNHGPAACIEYHASSLPANTAEDCKKNEGIFASGATPCPPAGASGKCERATEIEYSYAGAVGDPKGSCEVMGYKWTDLKGAAGATTAATATPPPATPARPVTKKPRK